MPRQFKEEKGKKGVSAVVSDQKKGNTFKEGEGMKGASEVINSQEKEERLKTPVQLK